MKLNIQPKFNRDLNSAGQNLEILTSIGGDLSGRQAQNGVNFDFKFNMTLKFNVNRPKKLYGT